MNFVNEKFKIDFPLPTVLRNTVEEAEQLDEDNNEEFYCVADIIDVLAKEAYVNKLITQEQWDILVNRYPCE
jgi:hypothetical protein